MPHLYLFYHKNRKIEEEKTSAVCRGSDDSGDQTVLKEEEDLRFAFFPDPVVEPSGREGASGDSRDAIGDIAAGNVLTAEDFDGFIVEGIVVIFLEKEDLTGTQGVISEMGVDMRDSETEVFFIDHRVSSFYLSP